MKNYELIIQGPQTRFNWCSRGILYSESALGIWAVRPRLDNGENQPYNP